MSSHSTLNGDCVSKKHYYSNDEEAELIECLCFRFTHSFRDYLVCVEEVFGVLVDSSKGNDREQLTRLHRHLMQDLKTDKHLLF